MPVAGAAPGAQKAARDGALVDRTGAGTVDLDAGRGQVLLQQPRVGVRVAVEHRDPMGRVPGAALDATSRTTQRTSSSASEASASRTRLPRRAGAEPAGSAKPSRCTERSIASSARRCPVSPTMTSRSDRAASAGGEGRLGAGERLRQVEHDRAEGLGRCRPAGAESGGGAEDVGRVVPAPGNRWRTARCRRIRSRPRLEAPATPSGRPR